MQNEVQVCYLVLHSVCDVHGLQVVTDRWRSWLNYVLKCLHCATWLMYHVAEVFELLIHVCATWLMYLLLSVMKLG